MSRHGWGRHRFPPLTSWTSSSVASVANESRASFPVHGKASIFTQPGGRAAYAWDAPHSGSDRDAVLAS